MRKIIRICRLRGCAGGGLQAAGECVSHLFLHRRVKNGTHSFVNRPGPVAQGSGPGAFPYYIIKKG